MDNEIEKYRDGMRKVANLAFNNKGRCLRCGMEWPKQVLANGCGLCPRCQKQRTP